MDGFAVSGSKQGHLWGANIGNLRDLRKLQYLFHDGSGGVRVTPSPGTPAQGVELFRVVGEGEDGLREGVGGELPFEEQHARAGVRERSRIKRLVIGRGSRERNENAGLPPRAQ